MELSVQHVITLFNWSPVHVAMVHMIQHLFTPASSSCAFRIAISCKHRKLVLKTDKNLLVLTFNCFQQQKKPTPGQCGQLPIDQFESIKYLRKRKLFNLNRSQSNLQSLNTVFHDLMNTVKTLKHKCLDLREMYLPELYNIICIVKNDKTNK